MTDGDRTSLVPAHRGSNVLPCTPLFNRLVRFAHAEPPRLCVRDVNAGTEKTHVQLLTDVLAFRQKAWQHLSSETKHALDQHEEVYIAILAPGGYEFTVAILAALAMGAAVVPMTVLLPPEEAKYFIVKSRAVATFVSDGALRLGVALEKLIRNDNPHSTFECIPIAPSLQSQSLSASSILVSSDLYLNENAPAVVIFTSGTTGPPKGAVMRRGWIVDEALGVIDHYGISPDDTLLHVLPVHHATGLGINFFPFLVVGGVLEFRSGSFSPEWTWERWKNGSNIVFSGVPTIYMRMMRHYKQNLEARLDAKEYVDGARRLKTVLCGTSALPQPIDDFWADLIGRRILLRYGMTETGAVFRVRREDKSVPSGSVGHVFPGCDIRLSEGDQGEVYAKSPGMFSKFLFDADATRSAHTTDGYYKTGDIARREGDYYWIMGRASVDIIKSGGYKISALDIEREILALPYVQEVAVMAVPCQEYGERVGAAVCLTDGTNYLSIKGLRDDLRSRLAGYKMPTVLRVVAGELPKSGTGKVVKKTLSPALFPPDGYKSHAEVQLWDRTSEQGSSKL